MKKLFLNIIFVFAIMFTIMVCGSVHAIAWSESSTMAAPENVQVKFYVNDEEQNSLDLNVNEEVNVEARISFTLSTPNNGETDTLPTKVVISSENENIQITPTENELSYEFQGTGVNQNVTLTQNFIVTATSELSGAVVVLSADVNNEDVTYSSNTNTVSANLSINASVAQVTQITKADITLKVPKVGDKVEKITKDDGYGEYDSQSVFPTVSTTTEGLTVNAYWVKGLESESEELFYGTFEEDTYYYALIDFEAADGYELPSTFPDGIKINGEAPAEVFAVYGGKWNHCIAKIKVTSAASVYEYKEGANSTYTQGKDDKATFIVDADFSLFKEGGLVYVDDKQVDSKYYEAESGSTKITFTKEFMSSLSAGSHTLKLVFNDGGEAETKFTIETKVEEKNPQTGDNILLYLSVLGICILVSTGLIINRKRFN